MHIHIQTGGPVATNSYLVADESTKKAAVIDAARDTITPLLTIAAREGYEIQFLLLTHGHWDHIADHAVFSAARPEVPLLIHRLDEPKLIEPVSRLIHLPFEIPPRRADAYFEDHQEIPLGNTALQVAFTPGHSPGHVVFHNAREHILIAGDLLFAGSIGRTDLPDSDPHAMHLSLERILELPDATKVFPGHGPDTTLAHERKTNPWLSEI